MHLLETLLKAGFDNRASDLILKESAPPIFRVNGRLMVPKGVASLTSTDMEDIIRKAIGKVGFDRLFKEKDADFAVNASGMRARGNAYFHMGGLALALRLIPSRIPSFKSLNMPESVARVAELTKGLVLVTGPTGSGKTTTLASIIQQINTTRAMHIVTIEDPVEYVYHDELSTIEQREVGSDVISFPRALRAALRQNPDVILVGEMRDLETIETAILAAETGHLVFSTLHTSTATETVNRVISMFPPHQQHQVRRQLAEVLQAVVTQRLLPTRDMHGVVPAVEYMVATRRVRDYILDPDKTHELVSVIADGKVPYGMVTLDESLDILVRNGTVSFDVAVKYATRPSDFALKFQNLTK